MFSWNPKNWFTSKQIPVSEKKSHTIPLPKGSILERIFSGNGSTITARQAAEFYRNTPSVATAVDLIADSIEQIQPVLQTQDGKFEDSHEILDFLKSPNGFDTYHNFIGQLARNYLLTHDSLLTIAGNIRSKPLEMWAVSMQNVSPIQGVDEYPLNYVVSSGALRGNFIRDESNRKIGARFYDGVLKELFHIKGYSSTVEQIRGDSPLQAAANSIKQIISGQLHNLSILNNGGRLSLLIAFKDEGGEIDDDEHQDRIQAINEQFGGINNAGKIGVFSNADVSEVKEFGINNKDMDYSTLESMAAQGVYLRYKIPLPMVTTDASTFNNLLTAIEIFFDNAVLPLADVLFSGLSFALMHRFGLDPLKERLTFNPESIQPLKKRRLEEVKLRKEINIETINELRSLLLARESLGEEADILYQQANLIPLAADQETSDNEL